MKLLLHPQTENSVTTFLANPSHAVGIAGSPGAGKDYLSWHMAAELLGITLDKVPSHPRVFMIDVDAGEGIEKVRELQSFLSLKVPGSGTIKRCVIIRELEKLNHAAQNALLKTLEEPPADTVIICTLSHGQSLLPTISSRLQSIRVQPILYEQAIDSFQAFPRPDIDRAYHISEGNAGLMMALLEKNQEHPFAIEVLEAKAILQANSYERLAKIESILKDKERDVSKLLEALYKLLHAATFALSKQADPHSADIARLSRQTKEVLQAQQLIDDKVQPKLVLTRLFYSL